MTDPAPRLDNQSPELFGQTPWQTVGPFFHYGLPWRGAADLVGVSDLGARPDLFDARHWVLNEPSAKQPFKGEALLFHGRVTDGEGAPVSDALVEIWQADAAGRYPDAPSALGFPGFGRAATDDEGVFRFRTLRPGSPEGHAPHIALGVMGRGLIKRLVTRAYFEGEAANHADPVLAAVPEARRGTLMARPDAEGWRFDIRLQGEDETVFFAL